MFLSTQNKSQHIIIIFIPDFKLSLCSECCMLSSG